MEQTIARLARFTIAFALALAPAAAVADELSAPSNVEAKVESPQEVRLSWYSSSGASSYVVYRDSDGNGYSFRELQTTYSTSFDDSDVRPGHTYVYVVKAKNESGALSAASNQVKAITPPEAPTYLSAKVESDRYIQLSWNSVSNVSSYVILRSTDSGEYNLREVGTSYGSSYTDNDVHEGKAYYYVVKAKSEGGALSAGSNTANAVMPLPAPDGLSASASSESEIRLSWSSVSGADSYVIFRDTDSGGYSYREVGTSYGSYYSDSGLEPGKTYYYVVEAKSSISKSGKSRQANATTSAKSN